MKHYLSAFFAKFQYFPRFSVWLFIILFLGISAIYHYHEILFFNPQSTHQYRQSDCLSITSNYYHKGMNFFKPSIHNLISDGGKTGYTIGEFPLLYYSVAGLWQMFGPHEYIYRLVVILLAFIGLLALFRTLEDLFSDSVWALVFSLLIFTFPYYAYYANNFLTNLPAFSLLLTGWSVFYQFFKSGRTRYFILAALIFLLAGLLKITALISFIALFGLYILERLNLKKFGREGALFNKPNLQLAPFVVVFGAIAGWYYYVKHFNAIHGGKYTFNSIWPVWEMKIGEIKETFLTVWGLWFPEYFSVPLFLLILGCLILAFLNFKKLHPFFSWMILICLGGAILYLILWFNALRDHDYYVLNLLIVPVLAFTSVGLFLKENWPGLFKHPWLKVGMILFLGYNVAYCAERMDVRYWGVWNNCWEQCDFYANDEFAEIKPKLREHGIGRNDTVISIPDVSFNISLYLMDVNGYTNMGGDNSDSAEIARNIKNGAGYLVVSDSSLYQKDYLQPFIKEPVFSYQNVGVFDLRPLKASLRKNSEEN